MTDNNIFISSNNNESKDEKSDSLPKLLLNNSQNNNKSYNNNFEENNGIKSIMLRKKQQINELDNLYNVVYNNKNNFFEKYPSKSVETYFKKYTNKRIPVANYRIGSNIHGLLEDLQQIVKKTDFYKIAENSNNVKKELINKRGLSYNKLIDNNHDIDKIQEMDDKIPELHYIFAEALLTNKARENFKKK